MGVCVGGGGRLGEGGINCITSSTFFSTLCVLLGDWVREEEGGIELSNMQVIFKAM